MLPIDDLRTALAHATPFFFSGYVTRFSRETFRATIGSPMGSLTRAGRYNYGFPALYTSLSRHAALEEVVQSLPDEAPLEPYVMATLAFRNLRTIDLTQTLLLKRLGTIRAELCSYRDPSVRHPAQDLGLAAFDAGADALLVWSAIYPNAKNLVVFAVDPPQFTVVRRVLRLAE